jgi:hypothetical protein
MFGEMTSFTLVDTMENLVKKQTTFLLTALLLAPLVALYASG